MKVMGISTCGTYKKAVKWLEENEVSFDTINLRETPPSKSDIKRYHELSGKDIKTFFNTSGKVYRELDLKNKYKDMDLDDIYHLLSEEPMLIKRPLIVDGNYVRTGFKETEYIEKWGK
jgi:arsenate reductase